MSSIYLASKQMLAAAAMAAHKEASTWDFRVCYLGLGVSLMSAGLDLVGRGVCEIVKEAASPSQQNPADLRGKVQLLSQRNRRLALGVATLALGLASTSLGVWNFSAPGNGESIRKPLTPTAQKILSEANVKCFQQGDLKVSRNEMTCAVLDLVDQGKAKYWGFGRGACVMVISDDSVPQRAEISRLYTTNDSARFRAKYHCN